MAEIDRYLNELKASYSRTAKDIIKMLQWDSYSKGLAWQRKQILKQVFDKLDALGISTEEIAKLGAVEAVAEGGEQARKLAGFKSRVTPNTFLGMDEGAVDYAVKSIMGDTLLAIENAKTHIRDVMSSRYLDAKQNKKINRAITDALVGGKSVNEAARQLKGLIPAEWFDEYLKISDGYLIKVGGRRMRLDDYAHLTAHTRLAGASNAGSINWSLAHGFEFVQISKHDGSCEMCIPFELKIYHLGDGAKDSRGVFRQSIATLPNGRPPFHVYCRHRVLPYGVADMKVARDNGTKETVMESQSMQNNFVRLAVPAETTTEGVFYGLSETTSFVRRQIRTMEVKGKSVPVFAWEQNGVTVTDKAVMERLNKLKLPPSWQKVHVSSAPQSKLQAIGVDNAGRVQRRYSTEFVGKQDQQKFARIRKFSEDMPGIRRAVQRDMATGKPEAWLLDLEDKTVIRIGSTADRKAKVQAYGLTTLKSNHVTISGDTVRFKFTAKEGITWNRTIKDKQLATWLSERKQLVGRLDPLFPDVSAGKLNAYFKEISGGKYTVKDYRTYHGTRIAHDELKKYEKVRFASDNEKRKVVKDVLDKVSSFLGYTPKMAQTAYIDPMTWELIGGLPPVKLGKIGKVLKPVRTANLTPIQKKIIKAVARDEQRGLAITIDAGVKRSDALKIINANHDAVISMQRAGMRVDLVAKNLSIQEGHVTEGVYAMASGDGYKVFPEYLSAIQKQYAENIADIKQGLTPILFQTSEIDTAIHELGHNLYRKLSSKDADKWLTFYQEKGVDWENVTSMYAQENASECFAECVVGVVWHSKTAGTTMVKELLKKAGLMK